jgi:hypothetical protein
VKALRELKEKVKCAVVMHKMITSFNDENTEILQAAAERNKIIAALERKNLQLSLEVAERDKTISALERKQLEVEASCADRRCRDIRAALANSEETAPKRFRKASNGDASASSDAPWHQAPGGGWTSRSLSGQADF